MSDNLIERLRFTEEHGIFTAHENGMQAMPGEAADRIAALIAAGDRLAGFAGHDDQCQIMTHGVWSDEVPCTCGYGAAWQAWREVSGHE